MSVDDSAASDQRKQAEGAESEVRTNEQPGQNGGHTNAASGAPSHNEPVLQRQPNSGLTDADWRNPASMPAPKTQDELIEHLSSALEEMASSSSQPRQTNQNLPTQPLGPSQQIRSSLPPGTLPAKPQAKQDAPQHYFVLEGMAPPAVESKASPAQFEKTQPVPIEPRDGLQVRRMIATQQRMPAATAEEANAAQPVERSFRTQDEQVANPPLETNSNPPTRPVIASDPTVTEAQIGVPSVNQVQLPPMFSSRQVAQKDVTSDNDQHKARTGIQAIGKAANHEPQPANAPAPAPAPPNVTPSGQPEQTRSHPVLTGHNFAPRQADPRSTMSAMTALPGPAPQGQAPVPAPGPVSPLSAALASSLPSNPPTGHYIVPAALRDDAGAAPQSENSTQKTSSVDATPHTVTSSNPDMNNPVGPATSRPIPKIDQSGAVVVPSGGTQSDSGPYAKSAPTREISGPMAAVDTFDDAPADATLLAQETTFNSTTALDPLSRPFYSRPTAALPLPAPADLQPNPPQQQQQPASAPPEQPNSVPTNFPLPHNFGKWPQGTDSATVPWGSANNNSGQPNSARPSSAPQTGAANSIHQPSLSGMGNQPQATSRTNNPSQPIPSQPIPSQPLPSQPFPSQPIPPQPISQQPTSQQQQQPHAMAANPPQQQPHLQNEMANRQQHPPQPPAYPQPGMPTQPVQGTVSPPQPNKTPEQQSASSAITGAPLVVNPPNLPPFLGNPNSRRTYNDLREETGMVLPHTAPAPDPNQVLHEEFGKSVPGVTPASKGFETKQGKEKREAAEREREALNKIQLPAKTERHDNEQSDAHAEHAAAERIVAPRESAPRETSSRESKPRRQGDSGRSQRMSNQLHENTGSRSMRTSRGSGSGSNPIAFLQQNWRIAVIASLAVPLVVSVSALIIMQGQSFLNVSMSPSQRAGEDSFNEGNYDRAISYFNEAIKADDKRAVLYHDRARAYLRLQEYANAVADYSSAIKLEPNFLNARLDRAAAYYFLGDYPKAIADYDELIKSNDKNVDAYFGRGLSHSKLHSYDAALADLNKVVELKPAHPGAFEDIANIYLAQGKLDNAVDAYSRSLKNNKQDANAYYMRGNTYRRMGKISQALADFSSAIDVAPGRYEFYNDRGFALLESGKYREAIADFSTAMALSSNYDIARRNRQMAGNKLISSIGTPRSAEQFGDLAFAYFNLENYSDALSAANRALLQNSQYRPAMNIRAAIELKQKRFDYALTDSDNILKIKADDKDALLTRARANLNLGRYDKAIKDYDTCVAENDNTSLFALRERTLAHILANEGALAATDAQQFIDLNGWHNSLSGPTALLGWLAKRQLQDIDGASAILSQAETQMKSSQWPYPVFKFLKREITLSQLSQQAHNDRQKTDVRTWSGFDHLLGGMREEAHSDFDWVKRSGFRDNDDYLLSNEQLKAESDR